MAAMPLAFAHVGAAHGRDAFDAERDGRWVLRCPWEEHRAHGALLRDTGGSPM